MEKLTRRYGLLTAICMVVGTVIGSGVFFKAQGVLVATGGNMPLGVAAWCITGLIMVICAAQFAIMATRHEKANGIIDYAEKTCGKGYAYFISWFLVNIYYPGMTSVLAWVSASYFGVIVGWSSTSSQVMLLAGFFMILSYAMNSLSPRLSGKFQVSATVIKLIPITLMAVIGTSIGIANGTLTHNFVTTVAEPMGGSMGSGLFAAIVTTVFAYEGWIVATSISAELKNPQKNLPIALVAGSIIVVLCYVLYYIGISGGASTEVLMQDGGTIKAFTNVFGTVGGALLNICIVVSCLGTLNGLMVAETRGMYAIAERKEGPKADMFSQIDKATNMTTNSAIWGLLLSGFWLLYFYGANLDSNGLWFGIFNFDSSELPIITIYALYIPMFIMWMKKEKGLGVFKRFILPLLSIVACGFMMFAAIYKHGIIPMQSALAEGRFECPVIFYLIVFAVIMLVGMLFYSPIKRRLFKKEHTVEENNDDEE